MRVYQKPCSEDRLAGVASYILELLREEPDRLAMLAAANGRRPPPGAGWICWAYLTPRIAARAGLVGVASLKLHTLQWSAWRLARRGEVELALTPMKRSLGRIRWARLTPRVVPVPAAHPFFVFRAHREAACS